MGAMTFPQKTDRAQIALTARGLIAETFQLPIGPAGTAMTSQQVVGTIIGLRAGDVITNIVTNTAAAGTSTAPTNIFLGLYSLAGSRLALTADLAASSNWTATGPSQSPLTVPYTVTADGGYYVAFLMNGAFAGTALQLFRGTNSLDPLKGVGAAAAFAVNQTGQATLPVSATFTVVNPPFWFGVN